MPTVLGFGFAPQNTVDSSSGAIEGGYIPYVLMLASLQLLANMDPRDWMKYSSESRL
jgi:hypothetical protein